MKTKMRVGDGTPGPGRPKGSQNKATKAIREAFHEAFFERGGVKRLLQWAEDNETEFYRLAARLIPVEINGSIETREAEDMTDAELTSIASRGSARAIAPKVGQKQLN